ncbi:hypothetical protein BT96DRAFT_1014220 [Gymnopus androsaceus JB14]|uniref:F-box domain-containing protein n=1 Tax=Gymnopus androsaceus JB14 TaxID=1447944 RepID=A0A6A4IE90_9AGAR|nr:hypothetical protein BT96DRAFT_1014220 [Gymnopus androsaceus JB14]
MNHFTLTCKDEETTGGIRDTPALTLSSVCSRWRRNVLSMPSLWSGISLACRQSMSGTDGYDEKLPFILDILLRRALPHPLTIAIDVAADFEDFKHPVLTRLTNDTHRWRSFTLQSDTDGLLSLFEHRDPALNPPNFPLLEILDLRIIMEDDSDLNMFVHTAPKLKNIVVPRIPTRSSLEFSIFAPLAHLEFWFPYVDEIQNITDNCHCLLSLKTEEAVHSDEEESPPNPTPCRTVNSLILLHDSAGSKDCSIFPYLTLPSLKTIHLERGNQVMRQADWTNFDCFMAFLSRSSCSLTTLSIQSLALADLKLIVLLTHLPTLLDLCVDDSYVLPEASPITDQFIDSLHVHRTNSHRPIIPRLQFLKLDVGASTFGDASVTDMVRSRWLPKFRVSGGIGALGRLSAGVYDQVSKSRRGRGCV